MKLKAISRGLFTKQPWEIAFNFKIINHPACGTPPKKIRRGKA